MCSPINPSSISMDEKMEESSRPMSSAKQRILQARELDEKIGKQEVRETEARRVSEELIARIISSFSQESK